MRKILNDLIKENVPTASEESIIEIVDLFEEKKYTKGHIFKHAGNRSSYIGIILEGMASMQWIEDKRKHHVQILSQHDILCDTLSIKQQKASPFEIQIEKDSIIAICEVNQFNALLETSLTLNIFIRDYVIEKSLELGQRLTLFLCGDSHQRYKHLLKTYPELLTDFPLKTTASMLGVSPTQLSRLRKK